MQNTAIDPVNVVTFDTRPVFEWKPMSDEYINSCLEEVGQIGYRISVIFE